jgi:hypothetical protein
MNNKKIGWDTLEDLIESLENMRELLKKAKKEGILKYRNRKSTVLDKRLKGNKKSLDK